MVLVAGDAWNSTKDKTGSFGFMKDPRTTLWLAVIYGVANGLDALIEDGVMAFIVMAFGSTTLGIAIAFGVIYVLLAIFQKTDFRSTVLNWILVLGTAISVMSAVAILNAA